MASIPQPGGAGGALRRLQAEIDEFLRLLAETRAAAGRIEEEVRVLQQRPPGRASPEPPLPARKAAASVPGPEGGAS